MTPPDLPSLREVVRKHDLKARKSLGQHFLLDTNLTGRIVRAAGDLTGYHVIEVGPRSNFNNMVTRQIASCPDYPSCQISVEKEVLAKGLACFEIVFANDLAERRQIRWRHCALMPRNRAISEAIRSAATMLVSSAMPLPAISMDIAGKGIADETSMVAALRMASEIARFRGIKAQ